MANTGSRLACCQNSWYIYQEFSWWFLDIIDLYTHNLLFGRNINNIYFYGSKCKMVTGVPVCFFFWYYTSLRIFKYWHSLYCSMIFVFLSMNWSTSVFCSHTILLLPSSVELVVVSFSATICQWIGLISRSSNVTLFTSTTMLSACTLGGHIWVSFL